jgi:flagellar biosynthesis protein FlhG
MNDQAKELRSRIEALQKPDTPHTISNIQVMTITSGKGGVGKSNFTTNIALALQRQGKKPLVLDADFGLANIEVIFGENPKYNLSHLIHGECNMEELITHSKYGVPFISGGSGVKDMMFLEEKQIDHIANSLVEIDHFAEILLIDTGAGINDIVLKFCMIAKEVYVVVTPEPASITDAYALMKTLIKDFQINPTFKLVINKAESKKEAHQVFSKLAYVAKQFLGYELEYVGYVPYDDKLFQAVKKQLPILHYDEKAKSSKAYLEIANTILPKQENYTDQDSKRNWIHTFKSVFKNK